MFPILETHILIFPPLFNSRWASTWYLWNTFWRDATPPPTENTSNACFAVEYEFFRYTTISLGGVLVPAWFVSVCKWFFVATCYVSLWLCVLIASLFIFTIVLCGYMWCPMSFDVFFIVFCVFVCLCVCMLASYVFMRFVHFCVSGSGRAGLVERLPLARMRGGGANNLNWQSLRTLSRVHLCLNKYCHASRNSGLTVHLTSSSFVWSNDMNGTRLLCSSLVSYLIK